MEEPSTKAEEGVTEKKTNPMSIIYHPCQFLEEVLKALFGCLGFDSEKNEEKGSLQKTSSDEEQVVVEDSSYNQKCSQGAPASQEQAADVQDINSTTQSPSEVSAAKFVRRRPSRPDLSRGRGPQTN